MASRNRMKLQQAVWILNLSEKDDFDTAKKKYRKLMGTFHPDAVDRDQPEEIRQEYVRRSQEINEAYQVLREISEQGKWGSVQSCFEKQQRSETNSAKGHSGQKQAGGYREQNWKEKYQQNSASDREKWAPYQNGEEKESAFCERNIYCHYSMKTETETPLSYKAARGRYFWNPEEETFSLFLTSLHHASKELLEQAEEVWLASGKGKMGISAEERFARQAQLIPLLAGQILHPVKTLQRLAKPEQTDENGRVIYHFQAFLGAGVYGTFGKQVDALKEGDWLFPESFQGNKIMVKTQEGMSLGHLSLKEDWLYFCLIPLLKKRKGQIKMVVRQKKAVRKNGRRQTMAEIDLYFRMEPELLWHADSDTNLEIAKILNF